MKINLWLLRENIKKLCHGLQLDWLSQLNKMINYIEGCSIINYSAKQVMFFIDTKYVMYRNLLNQLIRKCKKKYYSEQIVNAINDTKKLGIL